MTQTPFTAPGSWVPGAVSSGFDLDNLPYGVARIGAGQAAGYAIVNAIGDYALNLHSAAKAGLLMVGPHTLAALSAPDLNALLAAPRAAHKKLRQQVQALLAAETGREALRPHLLARRDLSLACPLNPGDFIDFYASYHHAVRSMKAAGIPDAEPAKNWFSLPVGYHSRTASLLGPKAQILRPRGQIRSPEGSVLTPTRSLDFEVEIGFVLRGSTPHGHHIRPENFADHVFGLILLNDWSARDIQSWEARPLGPHLAKSFASQVGAWVVPLDALAHARIPTPSQATALPYLRHDANWGFDIDLGVHLETAQMRHQSDAPQTIVRTNLRHMHWNGAQQLSHATVNGAPTRAGDLLGSGTVSGPELESAGCLLEHTDAGRRPIILDDGTRRSWVEDGDRIILSGQARGKTGNIVSFGTLSGQVIPALAKDTTPVAAESD